MKHRWLVLMMLALVACGTDAPTIPGEPVIMPVPSTPDSLWIAAQGTDAVTVAWSGVDAVLNYEIEWQSYDDPSLRGIVATAQTSHAVRELATDQLYRFRVRSVRDGRESEWSSRAIGETLTPRTCTDERQVALDYTRKVVGEWDGTPLRVDILRNFPDHVTDADLRELLAPIGDTERQIQEQLGYPIFVMGDVIDIPAGADPSFNQNMERYWRTDSSNTLLPRERGQVIAFYMNDIAHPDWDSTGLGSPMSAHPCCGTVTYNARALGTWWTGDDPCCQGRGTANGRQGAVIVHELFHVLGYSHTGIPNGVSMRRGALHLPWETDSSKFFVSRAEIDALKCIFPRTT